MRPRFMNRGSAGPATNERQHRRCFNEAPIHESGKLHPLLPTQAPRCSASMRPRFMNRGSVCDFVERYLSVLLQ